MIRPGLFLFCLILCSNFQALAEGRITARLEDAMSKAQEEGTTVRAIIVLQDRLDIPAIDRRLTAEKTTPERRAYTVITELQRHAGRTQKNLLDFLESRSREDAPWYREFWIANIISLEAKPVVLRELGVRPDIATIDLDVRGKLIEPVRMEPAPSRLPGHAEPGLRVINAHRMWEAGFTGQGVIVMNIDTGVDGTHPALAGWWRGNHVPPSQAWHDPIEGTTFPVDRDYGVFAGHGTHTMGTLTGLDPVTADTIGVAPGSEWIAAITDFTASNTLSGMQWALDPDGDPSTTDDMPAVVSNSYRWDASSCETPYDEAIAALEAAGIAVIFAAGNEGPAAQSIISPAKINTTDLTVFAVGAIDGNEHDLPIADFSSRGPTDCSGDGNLIKPEVCAPGLFVRSAGVYPIYGYGWGTSMATPHVAGAIALLKEAYPEKTGNELKLMLYASARDLGVPGEDNVYGMGVIDVYAAYLDKVSPQDPRAPDSVIVYSDYLTPTSVELSWTDPTRLAGGDTLSDFRIGIWRDDELVAVVAQGMENYTDNGVTDGELYEYDLRTQDLSTDSLSVPVSRTVYAGGSPVPAPPSNLACYFNGTDVILTWNDPVSQSDGTPLDDLEKIYVYREDVLIDSISAGIETYADSVGAGFTVHYHLKAVDNEVPPNSSEPGERVPCFLGVSPDYLIWVGPDAYGPSRESGDSLFAALAANGESVFLTNDLFEFGSDLSIYEGIFVVLGVWWYNHVMHVADPEPPALESYLQNGGRLFLEGAVCFNWDPDYWGGYDIRPWFDIVDGPSSIEEVTGIQGLDYLSSSHFRYEGMNNVINDLQPVNSTALWRSDTGEYTCGVWNIGFGSGLSIGVSTLFGGLVNYSLGSGRTGALKERHHVEDKRTEPGLVIPPRPDRGAQPEFVKKFAHKPHRKENRQRSKDLLKFTGDGVQILADTKTELMAAYLELFRSNPPHARNASLNAVYHRPGIDTLIATCELVNPDSHSVSIQMVIEDLEGSVLDSVPMHDDGNHHDGAAGDGIYGNSWPVPAEERTYNARFCTHSLTLGTTAYQNEWFTSAGPVELATYSVISQDTLLNPGEAGNIKLTLFNQGTTATAFDVSAGLTAIDSCASILFTSNPTYGDIAAGDSANTAGYYTVLIGEDCAVDTEVDFAVDIASYGNTFWRDTLSIFVHPVGIGGEGERRIPLVFALNQNYPNPFNPSTTIAFDIPGNAGSKQRVILTIYDLRGRRVRTLVDSELEPGTHNIHWDGRNDRGEPVASGIYLYTLKAGEKEFTRKMTVLK